MLRDRYEPLDLFALVPTLGLAMEPMLAQIDTLLDDDTLFQAVKGDLARRHPRTRLDGCPSTPGEVVLRMLVVKRLYGWSYEQTGRWVADSQSLRQSCRVNAARVSADTTLVRWANLLQPSTLHTLLDHIVGLDQQCRVRRGRKRRIDGTVVETNIHHPTDSTLLHDGVRVLSRTLTKAKRLLRGTAEFAPDAVQGRTRSAKRQVKRIMEEGAAQRGEVEQGPIGVVARQPAGFIGQDEADPPEGDFGYQLAEARTLPVLAGLPQVGVDDVDAVGPPSPSCTACSMSWSPAPGGSRPRSAPGPYTMTTCASARRVSTPGASPICARSAPRSSGTDDARAQAMTGVFYALYVGCLQIVPPIEGPARGRVFDEVLQLYNLS